MGENIPIMNVFTQKFVFEESSSFLPAWFSFWDS